jgi:16S rRNA (cytosine1402-N4)-methyltransferase
MWDALHIPVLFKETLAGLDVQPNGDHIDGTVGAGGHASGILRMSAPRGRLLGVDRDPSAIEVSRRRLASFGDRVTLVQGNFADLQIIVERLGFGLVDGVVLDLGVSSMQLDLANRGFSFQEEGPLDMRFDPSASRSAAEIVNELPEDELADVIYWNGEEPAARAIARAIVAARPLSTTVQLAEVISSAVNSWTGRRARRRHRSGRHPATRTFQAIRIAVNDELAALERGLEAAVSVLKPGGRLAVITFHSLEDRIVKRFMVRESRDCICPPQMMVCTCGHRATLERVSRKPVRPSVSEIEKNRRSRSAKLRIAARRQDAA